MGEMGFQPSDDTADLDAMFPRDVKMTVGDFMSGIVFDDDSFHDADSDLTSNSGYGTARKKTKEFFRKYIDDVYSGKVGTLPARSLRCS